MTAIQRAIIAALRHGPLNQFQVAADIGKAPFVVRAELKALKRERYVTQRFRSEGHVWDLTSKGTEVAAGPLDLDTILGDGRR